MYCIKTYLSSISFPGKKDLLLDEGEEKLALIKTVATPTRSHFGYTYV